MSINLMTTIVDRKSVKKYHELYELNDHTVMFACLGDGTVSNDVLDYLGLDSSEKAVLFHVVQDTEWIEIKRQLERVLKIDAPGEGIAFTIPISSIGGRKPMQYLLEGREYQMEEESTLKNTTHELIIAIAESGYTELIMSAAREAGAYGGTVVHAKGTGIAAAEKFMGVTIAAEKEMVFIVTKTELKNPIMKSIMEKAGLNTKAKAIVFSLPVTDTAGLRLVED